MTSHQILFSLLERFKVVIRGTTPNSRLGQVREYVQASLQLEGSGYCGKPAT